MDNNNGPQSQPQSQMPPQVQSQPSVQPPIGYGSPPKKSKTGLIIGIVVGVIALVGIIVAVVLALTIFSGPSKEDYKEALKEVDSLVDDYAKMNLSNPMSHNMYEYDVYKEKAAQIKTIKNNLKQKFDNVSQNKAITSDKEVKAIYEKVQKKLSKVYAELDVFIEIYEKILPMLTKTHERAAGTDTVDLREEALQDNEDTMKKLQSELRTDTNKEFLKILLNTLSKMLVVLQNPVIEDLNQEWQVLAEEHTASLFAFRGKLEVVLTDMQNKDDIEELKAALEKKVKE